MGMMDDGERCVYPSDLSSLLTFNTRLLKIDVLHEAPLLSTPTQYLFPSLTTLCPLSSSLLPSLSTSSAPFLAPSPYFPSHQLLHPFVSPSPPPLLILNSLEWRHGDCLRQPALCQPLPASECCYWRLPYPAESLVLVCACVCKCMSVRRWERN